jgi:hypothetical protein
MSINDIQVPLEVGVASGATIHPSHKCCRVWQTQGHFIFSFQENALTTTSSYLLALESLSAPYLRSLPISHLLSHLQSRCHSKEEGTSQKQNANGVGRIKSKKASQDFVASLCYFMNSSFSHSLYPTPPNTQSHSLTLDRIKTRIKGTKLLGKSLNLFSFLLFFLDHGTNKS